MIQPDPDFPYLYFITTVTKNRRPIFGNPKLAERLNIMIRMASLQKGFTPLVFAILPDHVHLLVTTSVSERGLESPRSNKERNIFMGEGGLSSPPAVWELMRSIKGTFSRTLPAGNVWQRGFFRWYIDDSLDASRVIDYMIHNYQKTDLNERFGHEPYVWVDKDALARIL